MKYCFFLSCSTILLLLFFDKSILLLLLLSVVKKEKKLLLSTRRLTPNSLVIVIKKGQLVSCPLLLFILYWVGQQEDHQTLAANLKGAINVCYDLSLLRSVMYCKTLKVTTQQLLVPMCSVADLYDDLWVQFFFYIPGIHF